MKLETKFEVDAEVFYLVETKLKKAKIHSIDISIKPTATEIKYAFKTSDSTWDIVDESKVFGSKSEFINQLTEVE
jgi:hypothetical protein